MRIFAYEEAVEPALFFQEPSTPTRDKQQQKKPLSPITLNNDVRYIHVEIQEDMLHHLIRQGVLVVENLRGLDQQTHENVRALLLASLRARK